MTKPKVPTFEVTKIPEDIKPYVRKIELDYVQDGPDMFAVTFVNQSAEDQTKNLFTHASGKFVSQFKEGDEINFQFGYDNKNTNMLTGEITSVEAIYREHDPATFVIRGFDKLHRLSRGREQRTFEDVKDSDIAAIVAGELGLGCSADDSGKIYEHVFQNNISNIDFLYARARMINFEVDVEHGTLNFKKPQLDGGGPELKWRENVKRSRFYLSTTKQVSEVRVRGWCVKDKLEIIGKATNGEEVSIMAGDQYGGQVASGKFGKGNILTVVCNHPLETQEEADAFAKARLNELAMDFITGEAVVEGNVGIKAGTVVKMVDFGKKFDGNYYITRAIHTVKPGPGPGTGYTTRLSFKRTGVKSV